MARRVVREWISHATQTATSWVGSGLASTLVVLVVLGWLILGIPWGFSEQWHLWTHTVAALVTLLMVFVIQHTTNQESRATLVKLDELLRVHEGARQEIMAIEKTDLETLERVDQDMDEHPHSAPDNPTRSAGTRAEP